MPRTNESQAGEETLVLTVTRRFAASPERVFDAWLDTSALGRWLFATPGGVMKTVEADPRVGGNFVVAEQRGEVLAEHFGTYLEIDRPRRLVFSFTSDRNEPPSRVEITIEPSAGGCELTLVHAMDAKWADYADRVRGGWTMILQSLSKVVEEV
jgi:uncharacterized protein YndB with AHSA1/START domain